MRTVDRVDGFQRRHPVVGYPLAVVYKYLDDQGAYLAALITYYGFLSIFPLLLLLSSVLGFVTENNDTLKHQLLNSVLSQIPVLGRDLEDPGGLRGSVPAVVLGSLTALYGGLGIAQAIQHMSNTCWGVPRNHRPNPILARLRSAGVLLLMGIALVAIGWLPNLWEVLRGWPGVLLNVFIGTGLFLLLMKMTTAREQGWGRLLPGAMLVSLAWQGVIVLAPYFISVFVARSKDTYGVFGTVLAVLIAGYILATALVVGTEMNVVRQRHLYPRALLTPFTDAVSLTLADQQAYAALAQMQRLKGYEYIDVVFDKDGDGVADQPSDLVKRWDHAKDAHETWARRGHPSRPTGMWGLTSDEPRDGSIDGSE